MLDISDVISTWFILGAIAFVWGYLSSFEPENAVKMEECIEDLSKECGISPKKGAFIIYASMFLFGFIFIPFILIKKLVALFKKEK